MDIVVGCDYSTKFIHLAWNINNWEWKRVPVNPDLLSFIETVGSELPSCKWKVGDTAKLYIERPWSRYNPQTALQLQRIATIVDVVATQAGYETIWVPIAHWRSTLFGKGRYTTAIAKVLSVKLATETIGMEVDHNTADAVCLALYGAKQ
jgi:hypothetical protein